MVAGGSVEFNAGGDVLQSGSLVASLGGDVTYNIADDLRLDAVRNTVTYEDGSESRSVSVSFGTNAVQANYNESKSSSKSADNIYTNSATLADGTITYNVGGDMTGAGYNAEAKHIVADVDGDMILNSMQNTGNSNNSSSSFGLGVGKGNISGNVANSKGSGSYAQTGISSIIGTESVDINVDGNLSMSGSMIANLDGEGNDLGNLNINAGSFEYEDLRDFSENSQSGFSVGVSTGNPLGENKTPRGSTTIGFTDTGHETEGKTYATIGQGTVTINDGTDISGLNRDTANVQETTKDMVTGALDGSVTIDNRLFTSEGRADIAEDFKNFDENVERIGQNILEDNIIAYSIRESVDSEKTFMDVAKDYVDVDGRVQDIQDNKGLTDTLNGLTNEDAATVDAAVDAVADIANENVKDVDAGIYSADGSEKGYAYDANGSQEIQVGVNVKNTDVANSGEVVNTIFHETTESTEHSRNEQAALDRGEMAERIWNMKNYGNENTNTMTGQDWYEGNKDHVVLGEGNYNYYSSRGGHLNDSSSTFNYYDMQRGLVEKGDTWESIAKEINDFYGINLTPEQLQKINSKSDLDELIAGESIVAGTITNITSEDGKTTGETIWKVEYDKEKIDLGYWGGLTWDQKQITHYQRDNFYDDSAEAELGQKLALIENPYISEDTKQAARDWIKANFNPVGDTGTHNVGVDENLSKDERNQDYRGKGDNTGQQFIWSPGHVDPVTGEYVPGKFDHSYVNKGTYDYVSPDESIRGHMKMDVDTWLVWGNTTKDRGNIQSVLERRDSLSQGLGVLGFTGYINGKNSLYDAFIMKHLIEKGPIRSTPEAVQ